MNANDSNPSAAAAPGFLRSCWEKRELLGMLAGRNLKIRYKGSALGFFWSLLTPLAMIAIYGVFAGVLGLRRELLGLGGASFNYLPFLVVGVVTWQFTSGSLSDSLYAIAGNANLVKKVYFPRSILPASTVLANTVNFLLTFVVLLAYLALTGALRVGGLAWLAPAFALHFVLCMGVAFLVSTLNVFFRDTEHIVGLGLLAWFFLSPIMYETSLQMTAVRNMLPPKLYGLVFLNPMTGILAMYRKGLMGMDLMPTSPATGVPLDPAWLLLSLAGALLILLAGALALRAGNRRFGDVL